MASCFWMIRFLVEDEAADFRFLLDGVDTFLVRKAAKGAFSLKQWLTLLFCVGRERMDNRIRYIREIEWHVTTREKHSSNLLENFFVRCFLPNGQMELFGRELVGTQRFGGARRF